jgi:hypothetical protein
MRMSSNLDHTAPAHSLTSRSYETKDDLKQMQELLVDT